MSKSHPSIKISKQAAHAVDKWLVGRSRYTGRTVIKTLLQDVAIQAYKQGHYSNSNWRQSAQLLALEKKVETLTNSLNKLKLKEITKCQPKPISSQQVKRSLLPPKGQRSLKKVSKRKGKNGSLSKREKFQLSR